MKYKSKFLEITLCLAFLVRIWVLLTSGGCAHPDEIFQSIEPAHKLVYGYGIMSWEWTEGTRSWFLPFAYADLLNVARRVGIDNSLHLVFLAYFFNLLFSLTVVYAMYVIGRALQSQRVGAIAALLGATFPLITLFASRPLSEVLSLDCILLALALIYKNIKAKNVFTMVLAGLFLGLSFIIRFASGLFLIPVLIFIFIKYDRRCLAGFTIALGLLLLAGGLLDYITWGSFWHAPIQYFNFNILRHRSSFYGAEPFYWYGKLLLFDKQFLVAFTLLLFFIVGAFRGPFLSFLCILYLLCFSFISHKEARFMLPLYPLILILVALGIDRAGKALVKQEHKQKVLTVGFTIILALFFLAATPKTIQKEMGYISWQRGMFSGMNFVGRQNDALGLIYTGHWSVSGGYFYLHKDIPIVFCTPEESCRPGHCNYAITNNQSFPGFLKQGWVQVARFGDAFVYKREGYSLFLR